MSNERLGTPPDTGHDTQAEAATSLHPGPAAAARPAPVPIVIEHVSHTFDAGTPRAHQVLCDIDLTLDEHRVGIIGHNGSGKSTLIRMLDGLIQPSSGRITVAGHDTVRNVKEVRRRTGFIFTDPDHQIIMPTVREDVAFSLRRSGLTKAELDAKVDDTLARFGLADCAAKPAHLLSGGQKQLLALAAVLVTEPTLLLADEPTTLLDIRNTRMFAQLIADLPQTIVMATHHLGLLADFDRVVVCDKGRVVADGTPAETVGYYERLMDESGYDTPMSRLPAPTPTTPLPAQAPAIPAPAPVPAPTPAPGQVTPPPTGTPA